MCRGTIEGVTFAAPPGAPAADDPGIDTLMGGNGRQQVADRIKAAGGSWDQYVAWGKALFFTSSVPDPPVGPRPSPKISQYFTCSNCHNVAREDPVLTDQDPEARLRYIQDKPSLALLQGTTFWGAVNRVSFYNGYYAQYHDLCTPENTTNTQVANGGPDDKGRCAPGTRKMNPASFEDAIQICSGYCSLGRYMLRWELDAMLAYFWNLEVRLSDLGLSKEEEGKVRAALVPLSRGAKAVEEARALLASRYLRAAGDTFRNMPALKHNINAGTWTVGAYPNGKSYVGDTARGRQIYDRGCAHCHGTALMPMEGGPLVGDVGSFYQVLAKGTYETEQPYMPEFTLQRLSRQQAADVQAYLQQLAREGR